MSDKPTTKTSDLDPRERLDGYYWKRRSYCDLWRYHDMMYQELVGHPYNDRLPEIIQIQDTDDDRERYYETMFNLLNLETHKRTKYDVVSKINKIKGSAPDLGIDVLELTEYYHCGDLTQGLFVYHVKYDSVSYWAGVQDGDVIIKVKRPEVEKRPYKLWKNNVYNVIKTNNELSIKDIDTDYKYYIINTISDMLKVYDLLHDKELIVLTVIRDGEQVDIPMNVPFKDKLYMRIVVPKIVVKKIPEFYIKDGEMIMKYTEIRNVTNKVANDMMNDLFLKLDVDIDDGNLVMDIPDTMNDVTFSIDENGDLVVEYE